MHVNSGDDGRHANGHDLELPRPRASAPEREPPIATAADLSRVVEHDTRFGIRSAVLVHEHAENGPTIRGVCLELRTDEKIATHHPQLGGGDIRPSRDRSRVGVDLDPVGRRDAAYRVVPVGIRERHAEYAALPQTVLLVVGRYDPGYLDPRARDRGSRRDVPNRSVDEAAVPRRLTATHPPPQRPERWQRKVQLPTRAADDVAPRPAAQPAATPAR